MNNTLARVTIENIWTRIFYENKVLKYEISIELFDGRQVIYEVFEEYNEYRGSLNNLMKAKEKKEQIDLDVSTASYRV